MKKMIAFVAVMGIAGVSDAFAGCGGMMGMGYPPPIPVSVPMMCQSMLPMPPMMAPMPMMPMPMMPPMMGMGANCGGGCVRDCGWAQRPSRLGDNAQAFPLEMGRVVVTTEDLGYAPEVVLHPTPARVSDDPEDDQITVKDGSAPVSVQLVYPEVSDTPPPMIKIAEPEPRVGTSDPKSGKSQASSRTRQRSGNLNSSGYTGRENLPNPTHDPKLGLAPTDESFAKKPVPGQK